MRDFPTISALTLLFGALVTLVNLLADLRTPSSIRGQALSRGRRRPRPPAVRERESRLLRTLERRARSERRWGQISLGPVVIVGLIASRR
jgi:hypothetical protein